MSSAYWHAVTGGITHRASPPCSHVSGHAGAAGRVRGRPTALATSITGPRRPADTAAWRVDGARRSLRVAAAADGDTGRACSGQRDTGRGRARVWHGRSDGRTDGRTDAWDSAHGVCESRGTSVSVRRAGWRPADVCFGSRSGRARGFTDVDGLALRGTLLLCRRVVRNAGSAAAKTVWPPPPPIDPDSSRTSAVHHRARVRMCACVRVLLRNVRFPRRRSDARQKTIAGALFESCTRPDGFS